MAVTKHILDQYSDLRKEIEEVQEKIDKLNVEIPKIEKRIHEIENGEKVKDKVRGGDGGNQSFTIEGIPIKEYEQKKTALYSKKLLLIQRKTTLELLKLEIVYEPHAYNSSHSAIVYACYVFLNIILFLLNLKF